MGAAVFIHYIIRNAEYHAKQTRRAINSDEPLHYFQQALTNLPASGACERAGVHKTMQNEPGR
jgi:hypothetical protein